MNANQATYPVRQLCRVLKVSPSGFYAWRDRQPSQRSVQDAVLTERIRLIHAGSDGAYGSPNIHAELRDQGSRVSRKRVARLMRLAGIRGVSRRRGVTVTTRRDKRQRPAPDLVNRRFVAEGPNQLWVADITYIRMAQGFVYLVAVMDWYSRYVISWSLSLTMELGFCLEALKRALRRGRPEIFNSDQGVQFTSQAFTGVLMSAIMKK